MYQSVHEAVEEYMAVCRNPSSFAAISTSTNNTFKKLATTSAAGAAAFIKVAPAHTNASLAIEKQNALDAIALRRQNLKRFLRFELTNRHLAEAASKSATAAPTPATTAVTGTAPEGLFSHTFLSALVTECLHCGSRREDAVRWAAAAASSTTRHTSSGLGPALDAFIFDDLLSDTAIKTAATTTTTDNINSKTKAELAFPPPLPFTDLLAMISDSDDDEDGQDGGADEEDAFPSAPGPAQRRGTVVAAATAKVTNTTKPLIAPPGAAAAAAISSLPVANMKTLQSIRNRFGPLLLVAERPMTTGDGGGAPRGGGVGSPSSALLFTTPKAQQQLQQDLTPMVQAFLAEIETQQKTKEDQEQPLYRRVSDTSFVAMLGGSSAPSGPDKRDGKGCAGAVHDQVGGGPALVRLWPCAEPATAAAVAAATAGGGDIKASGLTAPNCAGPLYECALRAIADSQRALLLPSSIFATPVVVGFSFSKSNKEGGVSATTTAAVSAAKDCDYYVTVTFLMPIPLAGQQTIGCASPPPQQLSLLDYLSVLWGTASGCTNTNTFISTSTTDSWLQIATDADGNPCYTLLGAVPVIAQAILADPSHAVTTTATSEQGTTGGRGGAAVVVASTAVQEACRQQAAAPFVYSSNNNAAASAMTGSGSLPITSLTASGQLLARFSAWARRIVPLMTTPGFGGEVAPAHGGIAEAFQLSALRTITATHALSSLLQLAQHIPTTTTTSSIILEGKEGNTPSASSPSSSSSCGFGESFLLELLALQQTYDVTTQQRPPPQGGPPPSAAATGGSSGGGACALLPFRFMTHPNVIEAAITSIVEHRLYMTSTAPFTDGATLMAAPAAASRSGTASRARSPGTAMSSRLGSPGAAGSYYPHHHRPMPEVLARLLGSFHCWATTAVEKEKEIRAVGGGNLALVILPSPMGASMLRLAALDTSVGVACCAELLPSETSRSRVAERELRLLSALLPASSASQAVLLGDTVLTTTSGLETKATASAVVTTSGNNNPDDTDWLDHTADLFLSAAQPFAPADTVFVASRCEAATVAFRYSARPIGMHVRLRLLRLWSYGLVLSHHVASSDTASLARSASATTTTTVALPAPQPLASVQRTAEVFTGFATMATQINQLFFAYFDSDRQRQQQHQPPSTRDSCSDKTFSSHTAQTPFVDLLTAVAIAAGVPLATYQQPSSLGEAAAENLDEGTNYAENDYVVAGPFTKPTFFTANPSTTNRPTPPARPQEQQGGIDQRRKSSTNSSSKHNVRKRASTIAIGSAFGALQALCERNYEHQQRRQRIAGRAKTLPVLDRQARATAQAAGALIFSRFPSLCGSAAAATSDSRKKPDALLHIPRAFREVHMPYPLALCLCQLMELLVASAAPSLCLGVCLQTLLALGFLNDIPAITANFMAIRSPESAISNSAATPNGHSSSLASSLSLRQRRQSSAAKADGASRKSFSSTTTNDPVLGTSQQMTAATMAAAASASAGDTATTTGAGADIGDNICFLIEEVVGQMMRTGTADDGAGGSSFTTTYIIRSLDDIAAVDEGLFDLCLAAPEEIAAIYYYLDALLCTLVAQSGQQLNKNNGTRLDNTNPKMAMLQRILASLLRVLAYVLDVAAEEADPVLQFDPDHVRAYVTYNYFPDLCQLQQEQQQQQKQKQDGIKRKNEPPKDDGGDGGGAAAMNVAAVEELQSKLEELIGALDEFSEDGSYEVDNAVQMEVAAIERAAGVMHTLTRRQSKKMSHRALKKENSVRVVAGSAKQAEEDDEDAREEASPLFLTGAGKELTDIGERMTGAALRRRSSVAAHTLVAMRQVQQVQHEGVRRRRASSIVSGHSDERNSSSTEEGLLLDEARTAAQQASDSYYTGLEALVGRRHPLVLLTSDAWAQGFYPPEEDEEAAEEAQQQLGSTSAHGGSESTSWIDQSSNELASLSMARTHTNTHRPAAGAPGAAGPPPPPLQPTTSASALSFSSSSNTAHRRLSVTLLEPSGVRQALETLTANDTVPSSSASLVKHSRSSRLLWVGAKAFLSQVPITGSLVDLATAEILCQQQQQQQGLSSVPPPAAAPPIIISHTLRYVILSLSTDLSIQHVSATAAAAYVLLCCTTNVASADRRTPPTTSASTTPTAGDDDHPNVLNSPTDDSDPFTTSLRNLVVAASAQLSSDTPATAQTQRADPPVASSSASSSQPQQQPPPGQRVAVAEPPQPQQDPFGNSNHNDGNTDSSFMGAFGGGPASSSFLTADGQWQSGAMSAAGNGNAVTTPKPRRRASSISFVTLPPQDPLLGSHDEARVFVRALLRRILPVVDPSINNNSNKGNLVNGAISDPFAVTVGVATPTATTIDKPPQQTTAAGGAAGPLEGKALLEDDATSSLVLSNNFSPLNVPASHGIDGMDPSAIISVMSPPPEHLISPTGTTASSAVADAAREETTTTAAVINEPRRRSATQAPPEQEVQKGEEDEDKHLSPLIANSADHSADIMEAHALAATTLQQSVVLLDAAKTATLPLALPSPADSEASRAAAVPSNTTATGSRSGSVFSGAATATAAHESRSAAPAPNTVVPASSVGGTSQPPTTTISTTTPTAAARGNSTRSENSDSVALEAIHLAQSALANVLSTIEAAAGSSPTKPPSSSRKVSATAAATATTPPKAAPSTTNTRSSSVVATGSAIADAEAMRQLLFTEREARISVVMAEERRGRRALAAAMVIDGRSCLEECFVRDNAAREQVRLFGAAPDLFFSQFELPGDDSATASVPNNGTIQEVQASAPIGMSQQQAAVAALVSRQFIGPLCAAFVQEAVMAPAIRNSEARLIAGGERNRGATAAEVVGGALEMEQQKEDRLVSTDVAHTSDTEAPAVTAVVAVTEADARATMQGLVAAESAVPVPPVAASATSGYAPRTRQPTTIASNKSPHQNKTSRSTVQAPAARLVPLTAPTSKQNDAAWVPSPPRTQNASTARKDFNKSSKTITPSANDESATAANTDTATGPVPSSPPARARAAPLSPCPPAAAPATARLPAISNTSSKLGGAVAINANAAGGHHGEGSSLSSAAGTTETAAPVTSHSSILSPRWARPRCTDTAKFPTIASPPLPPPPPGLFSATAVYGTPPPPPPNAKDHLPNLSARGAASTLKTTPATASTPPAPRRYPNTQQPTQQGGVYANTLLMHSAARDVLPSLSSPSKDHHNKGDVVTTTTTTTTNVAAPTHPPPLPVLGAMGRPPRHNTATTNSSGMSIGGGPTPPLPVKGSKDLTTMAGTYTAKLAMFDRFQQHLHGGTIPTTATGSPPRLLAATTTRGDEGGKNV